MSKTKKKVLVLEAPEHAIVARLKQVNLRGNNLVARAIELANMIATTRYAGNHNEISDAFNEMIKGLGGRQSKRFKEGDRQIIAGAIRSLEQQKKQLSENPPTRGAHEQTSAIPISQAAD